MRFFDKFKKKTEIKQERTQMLASNHGQIILQCAAKEESTKSENDTPSLNNIQDIVGSCIKLDDIKKITSLLAEKLSDKYYYISQQKLDMDCPIFFWLFLSRNRSNLLGVKATSCCNGYVIFDLAKTVDIVDLSSVSTKSVIELVFSCFDMKISVETSNHIIDMLNIDNGYEYISSLRFCHLFAIMENAYEYTTTVGYDVVTGRPYKISEFFQQSGFGWLRHISARQISFEQVAKYAKLYAPNSKYTTISNSNWRNVLNFKSSGIEESTTYRDKLNRDKYDAYVIFKENNGERFPFDLI
ncbi:MAG: hypothetical protein IKA17_03235 [Clostridia bacterium]|nr:hypothetical protein [Clostridia bacterium]